MFFAAVFDVCNLGHLHDPLLICLRVFLPLRADRDQPKTHPHCAIGDNVIVFSP